MKKLFVYAVELKAYKSFKKNKSSLVLKFRKHQTEGIFGRIHQKVMNEYTNQWASYKKVLAILNASTLYRVDIIKTMVSEKNNKVEFEKPGSKETLEAQIKVQIDAMSSLLTKAQKKIKKASKSPEEIALDEREQMLERREKEFEEKQARLAQE